MASNPGPDHRACQECRTTDGSCPHFGSGHPIGHPRPVTLSDGLVDWADDWTDDMDGLALLIPAPRRSPENIGVR